MTATTYRGTIEITTSGGDDLARFAGVLRQVSTRHMPRELYLALQNGTRSVPDGIRGQFLARLPRRGGLAARAAGAAIALHGKAGTSPSVAVTVTGIPRDMAGLDDGRIYHPTHGHRDRTVPQSVPASTITDGVEKRLDAVDREIEAALDRITAILTGS